MNEILNNWAILVAITACLTVGGTYVCRFYKLPTAVQLDNLKEWLLMACLKAEQELGSGTGQWKLRLVYDFAIERFEFVKFMPFNTFSRYVDVALIEVKKMLEKKEVRNLVNKE